MHAVVITVSCSTSLHSSPIWQLKESSTTWPLNKLRELSTYLALSLTWFTCSSWLTSLQSCSLTGYSSCGCTSQRPLKPLNKNTKLDPVNPAESHNRQRPLITFKQEFTIPSIIPLNQIERLCTYLLCNNFSNSSQAMNRLYLQT